MLPCLSFKSSSANSSIPALPGTNNVHAQTPLSGAGNSTDGSPAMSIQPSPTFNLTQEYLSIHTSSYHEMLSKIQIIDPNYMNHHNHDQNEVEVQSEEINEDNHNHDQNEVEVQSKEINEHKDLYQQLLSQVLEPDRERVDEALRQVGPDILTRLVCTFFDHSEKTTNLCLILLQRIYHTHSLYAPIRELLDNFPLDHHSITQLQCNKAFEVFLQFDSVDNPFHEMQRGISDLKLQLDHNIRKSQSRVRLLRHATTCSAVCIISTAVGVTIGALVVATHALVAIVAGPICTAYFSRGLTKKECAHVAQLEAARRGAYVLNKYLDTIDRLVTRLCTAIEGDKQLVQLGLGGAKDKHSIQEVVKQLRKGQLNFSGQLKDLEEHICLCFKTVNWARSLLLQTISLHQIRSP